MVYVRCSPPTPPLHLFPHVRVKPFSFKSFSPKDFVVREGDVRRFLVADVVSHFFVVVRVVRVIFL